MKKGFTLVELVITIAIVIILSVISVPIYRGYIDKAKFSEAYALLGVILSAQKTYYSEYGYFLKYQQTSGYTNYEPVLSIDARGNKYFTRFLVSRNGDWDPKIYFDAIALIPLELQSGGKTALRVAYWSTASGANFNLE